MKNTLFQKVLILSIVVGLGVAVFSAKAVSPTLSAYNTGSGDTVQVTVYGDPNSLVYIYYSSGYSSLQSRYLGSTNGGGYLSTTVNSSSYGISAGSSVYVIVNNQQSQSIIWPSYNYGYGSISLSQSHVSMALDRSVNITISGGNPPYTMSSDYGHIFQAVIGGNTLMIIPKSVGSGTISVCSGSYGCATLTVNVTSQSSGSISLSPSNISLSPNTSRTVTVSGNGNYFISNNTSPNVATAYLSGNSITVSALNSGVTTITVCQAYNQCATLYVNVTSYYPTPTPTVSPTPPVTLSNTSLNISSGQSSNVYIYGGLGYYSIAYNSNPNAIQASISGSTLTVNGLNAVTGAVVVCSSSQSCAALNVTITGSQSSGNWNYCANENQFCNFSGTQLVRYGANGVYYYRTFTNGVSCSNNIFGDPIFGQVKQCYYGRNL